MKKTIIVLILSCCFAGMAQNTYYYNRNGSPSGRSRTQGNTTYYYNSNGAPAGKARTQGNTTYFYNSNGSSAGKAVRSSNGTTYYYNSNGTPVGRSANSGNTTYYYNGNGTSFSTPVMAGAVTCLRQSNPNVSVQDFCDIIRQCGNRADNPDIRNGYGIPDLAKALEMLHVVEFQANEIITVYPNPSSGTVRVTLKEGVDAKVDVYDLMGRHLFNCSLNGMNHDALEPFLNSLGSGVYFVNANSDSGSQTIKVVLTR